MGKFTDDFFVFPIKIYDGYSLKRALKEEEDNLSLGPVPADWIVGHIRIPGRDLSKMVWHDGFSRDRTVEDVHKEGFDTTVVISDIYGEFVCTWNRKKFEAKLDEFMEKWNNEELEKIKAAMFNYPRFITYESNPQFDPPPGTDAKKDLE